MEPTPQVGGTRPRSRRLLLGATALGLVVASAYYVYAHRSGPASTTTEAVPSVVHLEPFVVNLADTGQSAYLRIGIDLGVTNDADKGSGTPMSTALIRDTLLEILTALNSDDIATLDGKQKLKEMMLKKLSARAPGLKVREIYFTEFLIQR